MYPPGPNRLLDRDLAAVPGKGVAGVVYKPSQAAGEAHGRHRRQGHGEVLTADLNGIRGRGLDRTHAGIGVEDVAAVIRPRELHFREGMLAEGAGLDDEVPALAVARVH